MPSPMMVALFPRGLSADLRFCILCCCSIALMCLDQQTPYFMWMRSAGLTALHPVYAIAQWPSQFAQLVGTYVGERAEQAQALQALTHRNRILSVKAHQWQAVAEENIRLRSLLHAKAQLPAAVQIAQVLAFNPEPFVRELTIDQGKYQGLQVGQVVVDAHGLMGQVVQLGWSSAVVLLITDASHALPVENRRTGEHVIVAGTGSDYLSMLHMTTTSDVQIGDVLQASALGGRFPKGYPVGTVERIVRDPGQPFLQVDVRPIAQLGRAQEVLLLSPAQGIPVKQEMPSQQPVSGE